MDSNQSRVGLNLIFNCISICKLLTFVLDFILKFFNYRKYNQKYQCSQRFFFSSFVWKLKPVPFSFYFHLYIDAYGTRLFSIYSQFIIPSRVFKENCFFIKKKKPKVFFVKNHCVDNKESLMPMGSHQSSVNIKIVLVS